MLEKYNFRRILASYFGYFKRKLFMPLFIWQLLKICIKFFLIILEAVNSTFNTASLKDIETVTSIWLTKATERFKTTTGDC